MTTRPRLSNVLTLVACAFAGGAGGCAVLGVATDKLMGPPPVKAQYAPGELTPLLVFVENYRDPTLSASDADRVGRMVSSALVDRKAAAVVSQDTLASVRDARRSTYSKMSVVDVGKAVGAAQVVYVDLGAVAVGAAAGSDVLRGIANARVKVVDVATGQTLFPGDVAEGVAVDHQTQMRRATPDITPDLLRGEALIGLSAKIARLFYEYQPSDMEALDTGI